MNGTLLNVLNIDNTFTAGKTLQKKGKQSNISAKIYVLRADVPCIRPIHSNSRGPFRERCQRHSCSPTSVQYQHGCNWEKFTNDTAVIL